MSSEIEDSGIPGITDNAEIFAAHYTLLLKSARRCAHDLAHASSSLAPRYPEEYQMFWKRSQMWLGIFAPDGIKDYRHNLHNEIAKLEYRVEGLIKLCKENNIDIGELEDLPW